MIYRTAVIGCGRIGSEFDEDPKRKMVSTHAGAYSAVNETKLVAACDLDEKKLEKCGKKWGIVSLYTDYEKMLKQEKLDIISICTWNSTHLEIIKKVINSGVRAIFCEKPIASRLEDADEIIRLCKQKNVILQVNHYRRFDKFYQDIKRLIKNDQLGKIQQISFYYTAGIANTGSHMLDLLRFFFGEVEWVQGIYSRNKSSNPDDPNIDGSLKFKNGIFCTVQACDVQSFLLFEMDCIGTKGRLRITHSGFDLEFYKIDESKIYSGYKELFKTTSPISLDISRESMISGVKHLSKCVKEMKKPICSGEDGRASLELMCAFHESVKSDELKIKLPLKNSDVEIKSK